MDLPVICLRNFFLRKEFQAYLRRPSDPSHLSFYWIPSTALKSQWEHSPPGLHYLSMGMSFCGLTLGTCHSQTSQWMRIGEAEYNRAAARITDSLTTATYWTAWCGSRSPLCLGSLRLFISLSLTHLRRVMRTAWSQSRAETKSEGVTVIVQFAYSCVSGRECWLSEYKWDVLIHRNQGHVFRHTVKRFEVNEVCLICHSAPGIKSCSFLS